MSRKIKKALFLFLIFFFIIATPSIIFYSWGYRFDIETKKIVKTGAFYLKIVPKGVKIFITPIEKGKINKEKEISKKTNFFFGAVLVENLLPKKYEINIAKEDFHSWKKTLEIKENQVTELKNIVLFPKKINLDLAIKNIEDFFPSPDGKIILLKESTQTATSFSATSSKNSSEWALKILETDSNVISSLINSKDISKKDEVKIVDLKFSFDSKNILLKTEVKEDLKYYLINLSETNQKIRELNFLTKETKDVFFHPQGEQKLLFFEKNSLFEAILNHEKIIPKEILKDIIPLDTINKNFYYFEKNGFLFKDDFFQKEKINKIPFEIQNSKQLKIHILSGNFFLIDEQKLYFLNNETGSFDFLFETNKEPQISPDRKKIVYFSDYEIWVLFLTPITSQPEKEIGEKIFIGRFSEKIEKTSFLNDYYLIFNAGNKIKIAEIDDRDVVNIIELGEFLSPKIFWKQDLKILFILTEGKFYIAKKIYPS